MQNQITKAFAELNAKMFARQLAWVFGRKEAVAEFRASEEAKTLRAQKWGSDLVSRRMLDIAGGKGWLEVTRMGEAGITEFVTKNVEGLIAARDARIIAALTKAGVTEIADFELVEVSDGFEGTFVVDGHHVTIKTILAGGYNIQCLHQRTLIKVR